ncbi:Rieske (2Fe-2S) protein [Streptomyces sp. NPDC052013]|uniref:Rieske (2Fe-2S) protein n=1 Tax=Streptomyces sp. NPDC052013 TaxID=3365679 RepID=UPI0037D937CD
MIAAGGALAGCAEDDRRSAVQDIAASAASELAREDQVPKGGGLVVDHAKVVLTRDSKGTLHAFSAICTHKGCTVATVSKGEIVCPCHDSRFDASTGEPVAGPARKPLSTLSVTVQDGVIRTR